jgi:hypothetical protein
MSDSSPNKLPEILSVETHRNLEIEPDTGSRKETRGLALRADRMALAIILLSSALLYPEAIKEALERLREAAPWALQKLANSLGWRG